MNLFTYGTLMFPEIWRRVVGRPFVTVPAMLAGYAVYRVAGGVYPVMVQAEPHVLVRGVIYFDVDDAALALLDEYESDLYDRVPVAATADDGRLIECQTYVLPPSRRSFASNVPWDAAWFKREALEQYVARLAGK
jgi:gamma-glutamylcyclotransferase (GGCT)/AIG2-like uncharacterized protein YtfP